MTGFAWLVGAGPGDPDLITVGALRRLRQADVVVHDRLLNRRLLAEARPGAELIDVGKTPGVAGTGQHELNDLLVRLVREGKQVVRLKGGDPFVFGRGGEEALALVAAGLPFSVVPGVSASVAAAAYAGIPVTHRGLAGSFAVVTGHEESGATGSNVDIGAIAGAVDTLVVMMGVQAMASVVEAALRGGRDPGTPAAVIEQGTFPGQRTVTGTLVTIEQVAAAAAIRSPAALVIGPVVGLRASLAWFEKRPLSGLRVVITRPAHQALDAARAFEDLGAEAIILPAVAVETCDQSTFTTAIHAVAAGDYAWVVFTSANGVDTFFPALAGLNFDVRAFGGVRVAAIGPATAARLEARGLRPDLIPEEFVAESLAADLIPSMTPGSRVLLARAASARPALREILGDAGFAVDELPLYETTVPTPDPATLARLKEGSVDVVTLASSSAASGLHAMLSGDLRSLAAVKIASIGPVTTTAARALGFDVTIEASPHTFDALVEGVVQAGRGAARSPAGASGLLTED